MSDTKPIGIVERICCAESPAEIQQLMGEARGRDFISAKTLRRCDCVARARAKQLKLQAEQKGR